ncbi:MAG: hypothetical protein WCZ85_02205 [Bacilli bacterium]
MMKNYYFTRNKDNIYRFYIFPQAFRARVRRRPTKKKKDLEIAYELLLERLKNAK